MLSFINQKGPLTKGIFRKSGSRKSCRILKEKLNSGDRVNLDSESVLVVASVLKYFLLNIQGSLLLSDLYDKWLGVFDEVTEEEKINAAQRLLAQLPKANVQQSSSNQMTAYNLSESVAPCILCPPNSSSFELIDNFIKKVSLVHFLIENCLKVFGEDITSLLGENSMSCDNNEKAAGTLPKKNTPSPLGPCGLVYFLISVFLHLGTLVISVSLISWPSLYLSLPLLSIT
uniref:Rho-GAP domain-containing protein n=1 Tax=Canis lupus familiaris TaxID=9615 RepID=A0A8C0RRX2_CANLF